MTHEELLLIVDNEVNRCKKVLGKKQSHYAGGGDRLRQFTSFMHLRRRDNRIQGVGDQLEKHVTKLFDMIDDRAPTGKANWDETIGDALNYLFLLRAVLEEDGYE